MHKLLTLFALFFVACSQPSAPGSVSTGSAYSSGTWTDSVSITPANLDTYNALQNPRTGARFTDGA